MLSQHQSHRFASDFVDDATLGRLLSQQPDRPARAAFWRRAADQRNERCSLRAIEPRLGARPGLLAKCVLQTAGEVALGHARNLPSIAAQGISRRLQGPAPIQQSKHLQAPPQPTAQCAS